MVYITLLFEWSIIDIKLEKSERNVFFITIENRIDR